MHKGNSNMKLFAKALQCWYYPSHHFKTGSNLGTPIVGLFSILENYEAKWISLYRTMHNCNEYIPIQQNYYVKPRPEDSEALFNIRPDIDKLFGEIRQELSSRRSVSIISNYYFDGKGKSLRPLIVLLMAKAVNIHVLNKPNILNSQRDIAKITEMIHTSSLLHDDVIDGADTRRGKPAVHSLFSHRKAVFVGDFILSIAATMLARIKHEYVTSLLSQVIADLVQGEFMQLSSQSDETDILTHYFNKTYNKTASLIAMSCKAIAVLAGADEDIQDMCYLYGKNCGIAFQLIDDMLDFTCTSNSLGKPNLNDLRSGLATAPVLFASEKFPELNEMIKRQFQDPLDVSKALSYVVASDGLEKTKFVAYKHCQQAILHISTLKPSSEQRSLILLTDNVINRRK